MIFGMPTLIEISELEENMKFCKSQGLQFLELNMNLPQYQLNHLEKIDNLKRLKEKYQVFYTIHLDENLNLCDFNPFVAEAYMKTVERTIQVAKQLNIPTINMHMNHGVHFTLPDRKIHLFEQYKESYLEGIRKFRSMCQKAIGDAGTVISIENTDGFTDYEKEAIELLLEIDVFGLTWDIGHSYSCDNQDESFILSHEKVLHHFHIHDANAGTNHMTLGTGEIDLVQRLDFAKKQNARCVVETKTVEALEKSVEWLKIGGYL